ncbi:MAG: DUF86 domain-containing protein [Chloroflexi bacterium]|nr:DUF86 domain-containing protein [Chloroflexota bacterium]
MSTPRAIGDFLRDIAENADKAQRFVRDITCEEFLQNEEKLYAVVRALEIIGEAARHIPPDVRARYPLLNWRGATGMRDKMIHDYFGVDAEVVWRTVHEDLPPLQAVIVVMLGDFEA